MSAFAWYGPRGPYVVYRYFHTAITAMAASGPFYRAHHEVGHCRDRERSFAEEHDVPHEIVEQLVAGQLWTNELISFGAWGLALSQVPFIINVFTSIKGGKKCTSDNPGSHHHRVGRA